MKKDYAVQGGVKNYLGETEEVTAPKYWKSSPSSPDTELVYITDAEKGLLLEADLHGSLLDNKPNIGASGLLSFDGFGSRDPGQNRAGGDVSRDMDRGRDDSGSRSSGGGSTKAFQGNQSKKYNTAMSEQRQKQVVKKNVQDLVNKGVDRKTAETGKTTIERTVDSIKDFVSKGGFIGNIFSSISSLADGFNKKRRNDYMSTYDIKQYELGTGKNWNPNNVTDVNSDEYKYLKSETDYFNNANIESNRDENNPDSFFDNPQDASINNLTTNTNPFSQVNNYFSTIGSSNLGISGDFMKAYDQAKADLSKSLNMTTNANQFGYNANMSASNIYYNYLKEQGLI